MVSQLTARQREVVVLLCVGFSAKEIAERLKIAPGTVRKHIEDIADKVPGSQKPIRRILLRSDELLAGYDYAILRIARGA